MGNKRIESVVRLEWDWPLRGAEGAARCRRLGSDNRWVEEVWKKRMSGWGSE